MPSGDPYRPGSPLSATPFATGPPLNAFQLIHVHFGVNLFSSTAFFAPLSLYSLLSSHCADQMADCCLKAGQQGFFAGWLLAGGLTGWAACRLFIVVNFSSSSALPGSHNSKSTLMVSTCTSSIYSPTDFRPYSTRPGGESGTDVLCANGRPFSWPLFTLSDRRCSKQLEMTIPGTGTGLNDPD